MRNKKVIHFHMALLFVFVSFGLTRQAFAETTTAGECLPGWNAKMERLRAAQRAHSCSGSATMTECRSMMGLGAVGIAAAAKTHGALGSRKAALAVRDAEFHACPLPTRTTSQLLLLNTLMIEPTWAACTSRLDIHKSTISSAILDLQDEVDNAIVAANQSLREMTKIESELDRLPPEQRKIRIAEIVEKSRTGQADEYTKMYDAYKAERIRLGYNEFVRAENEAGKLKSLKESQFNSLFSRYFGRPFNQNSDWNLDLSTMADRLPAGDRDRFNAVRRELYDAEVSRIMATRKIEGLEREPSIKALATKADNLNRGVVEIRNFKAKPDEYKAELGARVKALRENLAELEKSKAALGDFAQATKAAKSTGDLIAIAGRLHNFIPKEFLAEKGMNVFSSVAAGARATVESLISIDEKMTDLSHDLLRKWSSHLPKAGAGLRTTASLAAKGIAFVGGSFVSLATFASNEFAGGCPGTPSSANFPADPDKGCSRDFSFDNPAAAKLAAMDSKDLCELAKSNPNTGMEIDQMIATNYDRYYPGIRGQCGSPLKLSSSRWGNLTFDGKETLFTPIGETRPVSISYDERGNETSMRLPKYIRSGGTEKVDWGGSAPFGFGDRHEKATAIYRDMVRPILAEASACCSGSGVTPPASDCARWGLTGGTSTGTGRQPLRGGPTGR